MLIVESFIMGHTGDIASCEDSIVVTDDFVAVVDGATAKTGDLIDGVRPGAFAARVLSDVVRGLEPSSTATNAIRRMTEQLAYTLEASAPGSERPSASVAIYSVARREIWMVGDCQVIVDGQLFAQTKRVDEIAAAARSEYLAAELLLGAQYDELLESDPGRDFIMPLLNAQAAFRNGAKGDRYSYGAIDGTEVPDWFVTVHSVKHGEVVIATDGYPLLKPTLEESERALSRILSQDPLLIGQFQSTKGLRPGNQSFDDRAYVRMSL